MAHDPDSPPPNRSPNGNGDQRLRRLLVIPVAAAIVIAFLASLGYALVAGQYTPLTVTAPLMLTLAGYVFGVSLLSGLLGKY